MFVDIAEKKWENCVRGFMKKLLGILVLGLLWCNISFAGNIAHCNATRSANTDNTKWICNDDNTFTVNENISATKAWAVVTSAANNADRVKIHNYGTIRSTQSTASSINAGGSDLNEIYNYASGIIRSGNAPINVAGATNITIDNAGTVNSDNAKAIHSTGTNTNITNSGRIIATTLSAILVEGTEATVTNSGMINVSTLGTNYAIKSSGDDFTLDNNDGGTVQAPNYSVNLSGGSAIITNSGNIYGTTQRAIVLNSTGTKITNESGGTIQAGASGWDANDKLAVDVVSSATNLTLDNYGTITSGINTIKTASTGMTITNYSGGTISAQTDGSGYKAIFVDGNDNTIKNYGTISGAGDSNSINVDSGITGTNIVLGGSPTFTGEIDLEDTATTITLSCDLSKDIDLEVEGKTGMTITNNLCGNDTYEILDSSKNADGDNSEDNGYVRIDEGLEVVSNNTSYRSENVLTKLKGLFSAANYIDGVEPEDKFFRIFYSNVKRENMYKGSMAGVVGQLSPINWGNVTSNVFLGYSKHHGDFDNGEFLGGGNFALGLKNVFTKNGMKVSFSPMIGLNDLDVTDYDSDSTAKVKTNLLSEFLAVNGKIDKEIKTSEAGSLNLSFQSTLGLQRFPDYLSSFSDGDLSVDEAIEQVLSGGFEVKYNEELGKGFIIRPYVGVSLNHNLNNNIDIVKDDDSKPASPADSVTSGYYAGLTLNKKAKDINFDLDLMYGNEDGLINQIAAVSFTKTFGKVKVKTAKLEEKSDTLKVDKSSTTQDFDKDLKELEELRKANEALKAQNEALKVQNEKLKLLAQKTLEENQASKKLIVELLKENEKIKLEKQMMTNQILESENKDLLEQLEGSNEGNKPPVKFLIIFAIIFMFATIGLTSVVASIYNRIMYRPIKA